MTRNPPHIPNELVTAIFESLYDSLCFLPAHPLPDCPLGAGLVFSRCSLVSRTWHALALPFLARHFDGDDIEAFTRFTRRYKLDASTKSFHLNPRIVGWKDPEPMEKWPRGGGFVRGYVGRMIRLRAAVKTEHLHKKALAKQVARWTPAINSYLKHLVSLEIGPRDLDSFFVRSGGGQWDNRHASHWYGDDAELWIDTSAAFELLEYLKLVPVCPTVASLRLNVPIEPNLSPEDGIDDYDYQFAGLIAKTFPGLKHYTLHLNNDYDLEERDEEDWTFPPLETLRIINARSTAAGVEFNLRRIYLAPSAATLRHLEVELPGSLGGPDISPDNLFRNLTFPRLESLVIDSPELCYDQVDQREGAVFFDHFPKIRSVSMPFVWHPFDDFALATFPSSLRDLTLSSIYDAQLELVSRWLGHQDLADVRRLVLKGPSHAFREAKDQGSDTPAAPELPEADLALVHIVETCARNGVEFSYEHVGEEQEKPTVAGSKTVKPLEPCSESEDEDSAGYGGSYWDDDEDEGEDEEYDETEPWYAPTTFLT